MDGANGTSSKKYRLCECCQLNFRHGVLALLDGAVEITIRQLAG